MTKYCSNCGNKVNEEADICLKCGKFITKEEIKKNDKVGPIGVLIIVIGSLIALFFMFIAFLVIIDEAMEDSYEYEEIIEQIPTPNINKNIGTINDTLYYNNLSFKLNSAKTHEYIEILGDKKLPKNGYEYLILNFTITNKNDYDYNLDINKFKGSSDDNNINIIKIEGDTKTLNGLINSKMSLTGNVIFEIKKDWNNFNISYGEEYDKDKIIFKIVSPNNNSVRETEKF